MKKEQEKIDKLLKETIEMLKFTSWFDKIIFKIKCIFIKFKK